MKKSTILMIVILMTGYITVTAQTEPQYKPSIDQLYLTVEEVPNAVYWLPAPPEPGTTQFVHDINQYYWGKEQRLDSARLHACEEFLKDMAEARKEFKKQSR